jgi:hypothetical protein
MMMLRMILPLVLLAGCATTTEMAQGPDPKLTAALGDRVAGKSQSCIRLASRSRYFLADAPGCGSSRGHNDYILVQNVFGSQLCRGDIVRLVERVGGSTGGACAIRGFTPYTKPKS